MRAVPGIRRVRSLAMAGLGFVLMAVLALSLVNEALVTEVQAQSGDTGAEQRRREATRDSLRAEIARYAELIESLKSSVDEIDDEDKYLQFEESAAAISEAIGAVAGQLSALELEVDEGQISLSDGRGGRVVVEIPEDFGEQISQGIEGITRVLLDEMPDTLRIDGVETGFTFDRTGRGIEVAPVVLPEPRRIIEGNVVKFRDDLEITEDEVVLGDVVAIMGDAVVSGHIQGNLVVALGDVTLTETAEVEGEVVTALGRFERADGARVGSLTVVNPSEAYLPTALTGGAGDWVGFWSWQALFLLLLFLVLLMIALAPRERLERVYTILTTRATESFGVGLLLALVGHLVVLGLGAILVLTVIGIPVAILLVVAVGLIDLVAVGLSALVVGRRICTRGGLQCGNVWREVLLGMLVLHLPAFVAALCGAAGLPLFIVMLFSWASRILKFVAFCFGLGALMLGRFGSASASSPALPALDPVPETTSS